VQDCEDRSSSKRTMRGRANDSPNNGTQITSSGGTEYMLSCITSIYFQLVNIFSAGQYIFSWSVKLL
jgi:hypothetical protein